jgi:hypothetical protein
MKLNSNEGLNMTVKEKMSKRKTEIKMAQTGSEICCTERRKNMRNN